MSNMTTSDDALYTAISNAGDRIEVPREFICPITLHVMHHPLTTRAGHNFERSAILDWLQSNAVCPMTRTPLRPSFLIPNRHLEAKISLWKAAHNIPDEMDAVKETDNFVGYVPVSEKKHDKVIMRYLKSSTGRTKKKSDLKTFRAVAA